MLSANFSFPVPFHASSKAVGAAVNGWIFNGIATFSAGLPFTAQLATGVSNDGASVLAERPNLKPGASNNPNHGVSAGCTGFPAGTKLGGPDNYYDPCSFSLPLTGTYGNLGRDTLIGRGVADVDFSLEKGFKVQEKTTVTFKAEMFNIMNHANFGLPYNQPLNSDGTASPTTGLITYTTTSSRQIQFALRISF
jgi:hypothetical protein